MCRAALASSDRTGAAVDASASVRDWAAGEVVNRERGRVELSLNLTFNDSGGKTRGITGSVQASSITINTGCA
jgi:hypothetical protein